MTFYFAWVDKTATTFSADYAVEDEEVFALNISQGEGDFASAEIDLRNPRIGLLAPSRKQWAWISYRDGVGTLHPLFFGRLVSVPQQMQDNVIRLTFIARPGDFEAQKATLAEALKVFPYWDPLFFSEQDQADPDTVLEGRSQLWDTSRLTGVVTVTDIVTGEDGRIDYTPSDVFYDSVNVSYSTSPARKCIVQATVGWTQTGAGQMDISQLLLRAFQTVGPPDGLFSVGQQPRDGAGMINIANGDEFIKAWPQFGASIGGGWQVGESFASVVGDPPLDPIFVTGKTPFDVNGWNAAWEAIRDWEEFPNYRDQLRDAFERSPGFIVGVIDHTVPIVPNLGGFWIGQNFVHGAIDVLWVPVWQVAIGMTLQWETARDRTETVVFEIDADVQPLLTDPGEDEIVRLNIDGASVDSYIGDVRRNRYFDTDRGRQSLEHLIMRARAPLLARARAIDVQFQVPFDRGIALSCRKSASMRDDRLPGGVAAGKVKAYSLVADGDGATYAAVTIGCSVGRDGSIMPDDGNPDYVDEGYVDPPYQEYEGGLIVPTAGDVGYVLAASYAIADDGVNLAQINPADYLLNISIEGGLDEQMAATQYTHPQSPTTPGTVLSNSSIEAATKIANVRTVTKVVLRPVNGGPFDSMVYPTVTTLKVPRTIDLEDAKFRTAITGRMGKMTGAIDARALALDAAGALGKMGAAVTVDNSRHALAITGKLGKMGGTVNVLEEDDISITGALGKMSGSAVVGVPVQAAITGTLGQMGGSASVTVEDDSTGGGGAGVVEIGGDTVEIGGDTVEIGD